MPYSAVAVQCKNPECETHLTVLLYGNGTCRPCTECDGTHEGYEYPDGRYWFVPTLGLEE